MLALEHDVFAFPGGEAEPADTAPADEPVPSTTPPTVEPRGLPAATARRHGGTMSRGRVDAKGLQSARPNGGRAVQRPWAPEEDEALRAAVVANGESSWKATAAAVPGRTHGQCSYRWRQALKPCVVEGVQSVCGEGELKQSPRSPRLPLFRRALAANMTGKHSAKSKLTRTLLEKFRVESSRPPNKAKDKKNQGKNKKRRPLMAIRRSVANREKTFDLSEPGRKNDDNITKETGEENLAPEMGEAASAAAEDASAGEAAAAGVVAEMAPAAETAAENVALVGEAAAEAAAESE